MSMFADTIVALSSGRPPAAIAIVRTSGPQAIAAAELLAGPLPPPRTAALRALRDPRSDELLDNALLLRFAGPHSATGEDMVEYQCHGGHAVVTAVIDALTSMDGMRLAEPGEFTRRALAAGRIDLTEAEGLADLLSAETEGQRRAALALASGGLLQQIECWQTRLIDLHAQAEAAIDYVGDEYETGNLSVLHRGVDDLAAELNDWLLRPRMEPLRDGVRVVFAGPPNAGKSSLLNALVGYERAIVTPVAGTTRDSIEVPLAIDGLPFVLIDTAGLRESEDAIERFGIKRAAAEIARADIIVWMDDPATAPLHPHLIAVRSKSDLDQETAPNSATLLVSSRTGSNLPQLVARLRRAAAEILPAEGQIALNERQTTLLAEAVSYLRCGDDDLLLFAEGLRSARVAFDRLTGRAGIEEVIDAIFLRFCLGK